MKKILVGVIITLSLLAQNSMVRTGQSGAIDLSSTASITLKGGTSLPGTCTTKDIFVKTDASAALVIYICTATNTWTQQGSTAAITGVDINSSNQVTGINGASVPTSTKVLGTNGSAQAIAANVDDLSSVVYCADAGSTDAYACTLSPAPSAYTTGVHYRFKANTANTGAATINFNSLGAKTIKKVAGGITTDLADNDIRSGQFVDVVYDGTNMQMQSTLGNAASGGGSPAGATNAVQTNAGGGAFGSVTAPTSAYGQALVQISGSAPTFSQCILAGVILTGCSYIKVQGSNLATGDTDLYTCPTGKRCLVGTMSVHNPSAGSISYYFEIKVSATYYHLGTQVTLTTGTSTASAAHGNIILEAGEILAINTTTTAGLNCVAVVQNFDNTAALKTKKVTGPSTGDNVLYQVPSGGSAIVLSSTFGVPGNAANNIAGALTFVADGTTTRNVYYNIYANGGSAGTTNRMLSSQAISAGQRNTLSVNVTLGSQDVFSVNVDTGNAAQIFWINIVELTQ